MERNQNIQLIELNGNMSFGRHEKQDIRVYSGITSCNHGEFLYSGSTETYYYCDNNSSNGIFSNCKKLDSSKEYSTKTLS